MVRIYQFIGMEPSPRIRAALDRKARSIERRLKTFRPESARFEALLTRPEARNSRYEASFLLRMKRHTLRSGAQVRRDPLAAIQVAGDALVRQLERVKHRLRPATH